MTSEMVRIEMHITRPQPMGTDEDGAPINAGSPSRRSVGGAGHVRRRQERADRAPHHRGAA